MITIKVEIDKSCQMARVNDGVGNGLIEGMKNIVECVVKNKKEEIEIF